MQNPRDRLKKKLDKECLCLIGNFEIYYFLYSCKQMADSMCTMILHVQLSVHKTWYLVRGILINKTLVVSFNLKRKMKTLSSILPFIIINCWKPVVSV